MPTIAVIAEVRAGQLKRPSLEALGAARELAAKCGGTVVAIACGQGLDAATAELQGGGADTVIAVDAAPLASYSGDGYCRALHETIEPLSPDLVLMANTAMGRDLLPRLAAKARAGLVSDATALHFEDGKFGATKPIYAGKAYAKSLATRAPFMATLRPNNWQPTEGSAAETRSVTPSWSADELRAVVTEIVSGGADRVPLQEAKVVVAGGRGLKEPENFALIEKLAEAFGPGVAAVGASRAVVDAGWRPHREQVGQTGKVVAPTLYFAIGVSGAIQHLAGMRTSRCIVAINKDAEAPIFKVADYGIVGDALEVVPALTEAIKAAVDR